MHIRDREFDPFACRIKDNALPEIVDGYVFQQDVYKRQGDSIDYDSIVPHHVHAYEGQAAKILAVVYLSLIHISPLLNWRKPLK